MEYRRRIRATELVACGELDMYKTIQTYYFTLRKHLTANGPIIFVRSTRNVSKFIIHKASENCEFKVKTHNVYGI